MFIPLPFALLPTCPPGCHATAAIALIVHVGSERPSARGAPPASSEFHLNWRLSITLHATCVSQQVNRNHHSPFYIYPGSKMRRSEWNINFTRSLLLRGRRKGAHQTLQNQQVRVHILGKGKWEISRNLSLSWPSRFFCFILNLLERKLCQSHQDNARTPGQSSESPEAEGG